MHQAPVVAPRSPSGLVREITKSIKLVILTCLIGALAGALFSHFIQPHWVARMTVQIGQISTPTDGGITSRPVENQAAATVRYNLPGFRESVVNSLGLPAPDSGNRESEVIFNSMLISSARSPDLINLQVSAYSRDQAAAALIASFKAISAIHQKIYDPALNDMKGQLQSTSAKLTEAEGDYTHAYDAIRSSSTRSDGATNNSHDVLLTNMTTLINTQILDLRKQTVLLQEAMSPLLTYPTRIVEPPYVPKHPNTPSTVLLIAAGAALGLLMGGAYAARGFFRRG